MQLRRHCPGTSFAGPLVLAGPCARRFARGPGVGFVERVDVRVLNAAAGHAEL